MASASTTAAAIFAEGCAKVDFLKKEETTKVVTLNQRRAAVICACNEAKEAHKLNIYIFFKE